MRFSSAAAILLASETSMAANMKEQRAPRALSQQFSHTPITKELLKNAEYANRLNAKRQVQTHKSQVLLQSMIKSAPKHDNGGGPFIPMPPNVDMGASPQYKIVKKWDDVPDGWYVPDETFIYRYYDQLYDEATSGIGAWAIVAFNGGNYRGSGYGGDIQCIDGCVNDPMYDIWENPNISDVLVVAAEKGMPDPVAPKAPEVTKDPVSMEGGFGSSPHMIDTCSTTLCTHYGWECTCCRKPDIDPFTHKPIWPDWPGYEWFDRDMWGFKQYQGYVGWTEDGGYNIIPDGYFGYWLYLDQPGLWDYKDWEEYRFAITIRNDQTGGYVVWEPIAGVNELTDDGIYLYYYIFKIPDEDVNVGDYYTPVYYDGTVYGGQFEWSMWQQYDVGQIEIGAPYGGQSEFEHESAIISVLYWMADVDGDNCISKNEMWELVQWGRQDISVYQEFADGFFDPCDENGSGVLSWAELNTCIEMMGHDDGTAQMMQVMFKYFDFIGDGSYTVTKPEMISGILDVAGYVAKFHEHFNFYWSFFDIDDDTCVTLPEFDEIIKKVFIVDVTTITNYWINYYWTVFQITEYWWWRYKTADGGFDWEGFRRRRADGPAFNGDSFLFQTSDDQFGNYEGIFTQAFMWFHDDKCHFSLGYFDNYDPASSGDCKITGHETIGYAGNVTEIDFNFYNAPEKTHKMYYQLGEWGPTEMQSDDRWFSSDNGGMWLWKEPQEYCDPCYSEAEGYPSAEFWGDGSEYLASYYHGPTYDWASAMETSQEMTMSSSMESSTTTVVTEVTETEMVEV